MIEDQAINEQDDNKILHDVSDMFSLDQSELTEKLDQVEHLCKEWKALFKKWPDFTKEQRNRIREIQMIVPNLIPSSQDFEAKIDSERLQCRKEWELEQQEKEEEEFVLCLGPLTTKAITLLTLKKTQYLEIMAKSLYCVVKSTIKDLMPTRSNVLNSATSLMNW